MWLIVNRFIKELRDEMGIAEFLVFNAKCAIHGVARD